MLEEDPEDFSPNQDSPNVYDHSQERKVHVGGNEIEDIENGAETDRGGKIGAVVPYNV